MNRFWAFLLPALTSGFATVMLVPLSVHAAELPLFSQGWSLVPEACRDCACGFAGVLAIVQNAMNAMISLGIVVMTLIVAYAGITFMTASTNPEAKSKAKNMMINAVVGMLIVLSAWLIVDFVMKALYNPNLAGWGPWNTILGDSDGKTCIEAKTLSPLFSGSITAAPATTGSSGGNYTAGGTCTPQTSGACAASNFSAFGTAASEASEICNAESHGNASAVSGTDKLGDGTPYSFGLFQINITANRVAGLNCPNAFSKKSCTVSSCGPGSGAHVVNAALYNQCVAAAKKPANNIAAAHDIYLAAHARWTPWGTARGCGLAVIPGVRQAFAIMDICSNAS